MIVDDQKLPTNPALREVIFALERCAKYGGVEYPCHQVFEAAKSYVAYDYDRITTLSVFRLAAHTLRVAASERPLAEAFVPLAEPPKKREFTEQELNELDAGALVRRYDFGGKFLSRRHLVRKEALIHDYIMTFNELAAALGENNPDYSYCAREVRSWFYNSPVYEELLPAATAALTARAAAAFLAALEGGD